MFYLPGTELGPDEGGTPGAGVEWNQTLQEAEWEQFTWVYFIHFHN